MSKSIIEPQFDVSDTISSIIDNEKLKKKENNDDVLSELGSYTEEPYEIIESYFKGQHLDRLVRHQIESYNNFVNLQIQRTIKMFNPVVIHSLNDYVEQHDQYLLEILITFDNFKLYPPQIHENNGATKLMLPQEAKLRNFTYSSTMTVDLNIQYIIRNSEKMDNPKIINKDTEGVILPSLGVTFDSPLIECFNKFCEEI